MAKQLIIDRSLYFRSSVTLIRGDQWNIKGRIVDNVGGVLQDVDLTGAGATAYFPAASGGSLTQIASVSNPNAGEILITVAPEASLLAAISAGIAPYVGVSGTSDGPYTAQTTDSPVIIADPGFEVLV